MADGRVHWGANRTIVAFGSVLLVCSVLALGFGALLFAMNSGGDIWVLCDLATPSGHTLQNATTTTFPIGVACEWTDTDGTVYVRTIEEWWTTTASLWGGCVGLVLAVGVLIVAAVRRVRSRH